MMKLGKNIVLVSIMEGIMLTNRVLHWIRRYRFPLFIVILLLALLGSFQLYGSAYDNPWKSLSVIIYSTFMLFTFSPTNGILNEAPLAYEIAMWAAPMFTMVGFFSVFKRVFNTLRTSFYHMNQSHLVLMGTGEDALIFIKNMRRSQPEIRLMLLHDLTDTVDEEMFENLGVKTVALDFEEPVHPQNRERMKEEKVGDFGKIISFLPDPINYGRIEGLHQMFPEETTAMDVYMQVDNVRLKEITEQQMDKLTRFDISYFNVDELLVRYFYSHHHFELPNQVQKASSMEEMAENFGVHHLLFLGFTDFTRQFLEQSTNLLTINPMKDMQATIVDSNAQEKIDEFSKRRPMIHRVVDLKATEQSGSDLLVKIESAQENTPITALVIGYEDIGKSLFILDTIIDDVTDIPIVLYTKNQSAIAPMLESLRLRHEKIYTIGDASDVLNYDILIEEKLTQKAKEFNADYTTVMNSLMGWPNNESSMQEQWMELSNIKKESSTNQSMHNQTKWQIMRLIAKNEHQTAEELLAKWRSLLSEKSVQEQVQIIEEDPAINFMTALEHKRWNNFYYMRGFRFGDKDETKKTHDCLIDNWQVFLDGPQREKAIYDMLSVLSIEEKKDA